MNSNAYDAEKESQIRSRLLLQAITQKRSVAQCTHVLVKSQDFGKRLQLEDVCRRENDSAHSTFRTLSPSPALAEASSVVFSSSELACFSSASNSCKKQGERHLDTYS